MISVAISYISITLLMVISLLILLAYLKMRSVTNKLLALAGKEFHEKLDSILETPSEIPEIALDYLSMMMRIANSDRGPWQLFRVLRKKSGNPQQARASELATELPKMRPELEKLFHETTVLWLNWMVHRNVLLGMLISFEFRKIALRRNALDASHSDVEKTLFSNFSGVHC